MMMTYECNSSAGELALQQGITATQAGFNSLALAQLERAAELCPNNAKVWLWLAWQANSPDSTRRCLNRVLEISPGHSAATAGLIWISSLTADESFECGLKTDVIKEVSVSLASSREATVEPVASASPEADRLVELTTERTPQLIDQCEEVDSPIAVEPPPSVPAISLDADGWEISTTSKSVVAMSDSVMAADALPAHATTELEPSDSMESRQRRWTDLVNRVAEMPLQVHQVTSQDINASVVTVTESSIVVAPAAIAVTPVEVPESVPVVQSRLTDVPVAARGEESVSIHESHEEQTARVITHARHEEAEPETSTDVETLTQSFNPSTDVVTTDGRPLVMVVDDSPTVRKLVSLTLERRGYRVISAFDGVAAIKELGTSRPDLILLDINMPRLDGYRLCKLIKKHEATQNIPVVMLSGKDGMFDKLRGRLVGCSDYITKPFEADALTHKVAKYLAAVAANSL